MERKTKNEEQTHQIKIFLIFALFARSSLSLSREIVLLIMNPV